MPVSIERHGVVAVVRIDNPPVNAIGRQERQGLLDAARTLSEDGEVEVVILAGSDQSFAAGADAREFDAPPAAPHLPEAIDAIAASPKPWIAAINGAALGGGLEIALGCDYRIAAPVSTLGLPEVKLGLVPGAGGTQRLPRLVGFAQALTLISEGQPVRPDKALAMGLVDEMAEDPVQRAFAIAAAGLPKRRLSLEPAPQFDEALATAVRNTTARKALGSVAPLRAIELVELATSASFSDGMRRERDIFLELRASSQARALRHLFFAERRAGPSRDIAAVESANIERCAVIGGGTMGTGIAYALLQAGLDVIVVEVDEQGAARAEQRVRRLIEEGATRGLLTPEIASRIVARFRAQAGYSSLDDRDLVIEAAFEDMDAKKAIFAKLDTAAPHALLATNTSYLDIDEIALSVARPQDVVGIHFFAPAYLMKLVEVVRARKTSEKALAAAFALSRRLGKIPVPAKVCEGFIGNRILARYREAADTILLRGGLPWDVDEAMVEFGYPMGPYEAQDLSGLDIAYANRKRQARNRDPSRRYVAISDRMVEEGRIGKKGGVGWYRYPGGGGAVVDPLVEDLIAEESHFAKIARRDFSHEEIRKRLLAAMISEAAEILREGVAASPADVDLVTVHGYGFPRWRGGLMHYAAEQGLRAIIDDLREFSADDPFVWRISPGLAAMAEELERREPTSA